MSSYAKTPWRDAVGPGLAIWLNVAVLWLNIAVEHRSWGAWVAFGCAVLTVLLEVNGALYRRHHP